MNGDLLTLRRVKYSVLCCLASGPRVFGGIHAPVCNDDVTIAAITIACIAAEADQQSDLQNAEDMSESAPQQKTRLGRK
jgi:hypothetical protein